MSVARAKVFGMDLGVDPKLIVLALIVVAGGVYYFSSASESPAVSSGPIPAAINSPSPVRPPAASLRATAARRANAVRNDHGPLKLVSVDGSRGDVDPTLRLGLLERLQGVPAAGASRNLFEVGTAAPAKEMPAVPVNVPKMMPGDRAAAAEITPPPAPVFSIPLKYYGFVKPNGHAVDSSRGLFMDGDNILVGAEGDVLEKHYLIVVLSPNSARLEDTQAKHGQELQVTPEAPASQ